MCGVEESARETNNVLVQPVQSLIQLYKGKTFKGT